MYTLMKNKTHIHNKATTNILEREPRCQHRKINVTSALSRVVSELHRAEITAVVRYQTSKKESPPTIRYSGGHDHQTAAVVTTARSPLLPSQQLRRYQRRNGHDTAGRSPYSATSTQSITAVPEPRNAFHTRQDTAPIGNTTLPRTDVFTSFIRPSHEKKTCAHTDN